MSLVRNLHSIDEPVERSDVGVHFVCDAISLVIQTCHSRADCPTVQPLDVVLVHNGFHHRQRRGHIANCTCGIIGGSSDAVPYIEGLCMQLPVPDEHRYDDSSASIQTTTECQVQSQF